MFCKRLNLIMTAVLLMAIIGPFAYAAQEYDVAAFYWPSLHYDARWATFFTDGGQGEWESIRNCKPKWEGHWQPRVPAWGYLMDNDPAAMEKKIEAATSHGVNVMLFDWCWFDMPFIYGSKRPSAANLPDDLSDMVPRVVAGKRPGALWVLKAQWDAQQAIPNAKMVIIPDLEQHPDDLHLSTAGNLELGRLLAQGYLDMER